MEGPGIWVTCVKNKEKSTVGELYDVFESVRIWISCCRAAPQLTTCQVANELWPQKVAKDQDESDDDGGDDGEDDNIEAQLAKEVAAMKRPRKEQRFGMFFRVSLNSLSDRFPS